MCVYRNFSSNPGNNNILQILYYIFWWENFCINLWVCKSDSEKKNNDTYTCFMSCFICVKFLVNHLVLFGWLKKFHKYTSNSKTRMRTHFWYTFRSMPKKDDEIYKKNHLFFTHFKKFKFHLFFFEDFFLIFSSFNLKNYSQQGKSLKFVKYLFSIGLHLFLRFTFVITLGCYCWCLGAWECN